MEAVLQRFYAALDASVSDIERAAKTATRAPRPEDGDGEDAASPSGPSSVDERLSSLAAKVEELEENAEFGEVLYRRSGSALTKLVSLAERRVEAQRELLAAVAQERSVELAPPSPPPSPSLPPPLSSSSSSSSLSSPIRAQQRWQSPAAPGSALAPGTSGSVLRTPVLRRVIDDDAASIDSDPRTPTLEDFGLSASAYANSPASVRGAAHELVDEQEGGGVETVELVRVTDADLEILPRYLRGQVSTDVLNAVFQEVGELACASGDALDFSLEALQRKSPNLPCQAAVLSLVELGRLLAVGDGTYKLAS